MKPAHIVNGPTNDGRPNNRPANDRRREPRVSANIPLVVWGVDIKGRSFRQQARARDISLSGALLSGLDFELRCGDLVGILYSGKKARYRVVWVRPSGTDHKIQAAVHRLDPDACPWTELLAPERADEPHAASQPPEVLLED